MNRRELAFMTPCHKNNELVLIFFMLINVLSWIIIYYLMVCMIIVIVPQEKGTEVLARCIYTRRNLFKLVSHPDFIAFINFLHPLFKIPNWNKIANELLDSEYNSVKEQTDKKIAEASRISLQLDGWTNVC